MTAKTYDVKLELDSVTSFAPQQVVVGSTSNAAGVIAAIEDSTLKVRLANTLVPFSDSEVVTVSSIDTTDLASANLNYQLFSSNYQTGTTTIASANVVSTSPSAYIAEKNAFTQNPIVRLYKIYMPGSWYPPNEAGNPTGPGEGRAWPVQFPISFAEVVGDVVDDLSYAIQFGGESYTPFPVNISSFDQGSDGKINELSLSVFNVDNIISNLVEEPYLVGLNTSNSVSAIVNGEEVLGIDPRSVPGRPEYNSSIEAYYGKSNASFDYYQTQQVNGDWQKQKADTRDLHGAAVEITTTFANFLDYWPEYSSVVSSSGSEITVRNSLAYRVGDTVYSSSDDTQVTITDIQHNTLVCSDSIIADLGDNIYIVNPDADPDSCLKDVFKIDQLEGLSEYVATFGLVSWLQHFKAALPKRRYMKNTCAWVYKGEECQYPTDGTGDIPGSDKQANGYFTAAGVATDNPLEDICSKSYEACSLRNNQIHYGAFIGVGRTVPRG